MVVLGIMEHTFDSLDVLRAPGLPCLLCDDDPVTVHPVTGVGDERGLALGDEVDDMSG